MKKNQNKGFILLETLIVSVFMLSIFTFLYINIVPMNQRYSKTKHYDNLTSVYVADEIRYLIASDPNFDALVGGMDNLVVVHKDITNCNYYANTEICHALQTAFGITDVEITDGPTLQGKIYISRYELTQLKNKINTTTESERIFKGPNDAGIRDYINSLPRYTDSSISDGYRIFIIRNVQEDGEWVQKYASIEMRG